MLATNYVLAIALLFSALMGSVRMLGDELFHHPDAALVLHDVEGLSNPDIAEALGISRRNLIRKVQCHSGWDWGPSLLVSGIPGAIHLDATSTGRTEYVATTQHHRRNRVDLDVDVDVHAVSACTTALQVTIAGQQRRKPVTLKPGINHLHISLPVNNPKRWWPCGYGAQPLYDLQVAVAGDTLVKRIGFRTLEVINREDKAGLKTGLQRVTRRRGF